MSYLSETVRKHLDGTDLETKLGFTILLTVSQDMRWPRTALLSAGEVLAPSAAYIYIMLYAHSRTVQSLEASARGTLLIVVDGVLVRIYIETDVGPWPYSSNGTKIFKTRVIATEQDTVSYAHLLHGIEYELLNRDKTIRRWEKQLAVMNGLGLNE